jgi:protein TonB
MLQNRVCPDTDEDGAQAIAPIQRSVYAPPASSRFIGLAGTSVIFAAVVAGFFLTITRFTPVEVTPALTVVNPLPPASPPVTPPKENEAAKPVEKKEKPPAPSEVPPIEGIIVPLAPALVSMPVATPKPTDPGPVEPETAAPRTQPTPAAPKVSGKAAETWEGKVLARLNEHRRYPRSAMARRQQGVPYIRFVMDREGRVLSSRLERSSGFPDLDREAVALPKRASPLPKPPEDKAGDTLELVVPVEFFQR